MTIEECEAYNARICASQREWKKANPDKVRAREKRFIAKHGYRDYHNKVWRDERRRRTRERVLKEITAPFVTYETLASKVSAVDLAWFVGFYEGEGHACERMIMLTQKERWPLERAQTIMGGTISGKSSDGCLRWWICGVNARAVIKLMYPHLSPRRQGQIDSKFFTEEIFRTMRAKRFGLDINLVRFGPQTAAPGGVATMAGNQAMPGEQAGMVQ